MCMELNDRNIQQIEDIFARKYSEKTEIEKQEREKFETRIYSFFEKVADRLERSNEKQFAQTKDFFIQEIRIVSKFGEAQRELIIAKQEQHELKIKKHDHAIDKKAEPNDIKTALTDLKLKVSLTVIAGFAASIWLAWGYILPKLIEAALKRL